MDLCGVRGFKFKVLFYFAIMIRISYKTKQYLAQLVKILIVVAAFYFVYDQLNNNNQLDWQQFMAIFNRNKSVFGILLILLFSVLNRFLEILKWQNLAKTVQHISVLESTKQVLAALTLGVFTPVGLGEYAGKALYFKKSQTSEIVFLNVLCNGVQMVATAVFGFFAALVLGYYGWTFASIGIVIVVAIAIFFSKNVQIKGYALQDFITKVANVPTKIHYRNVVLGLARYLVFTHQYYFLLLGFEVNVGYPEAIATISLVYLLASIIPSFQFLDFALKGSLAIHFFQILGVNAWVVAFVTSLMWFLNVAIPVIIGSYFVLTFKVNPALSTNEKNKISTK